MNKTDVQGWLDRYLMAWRSNSAEAIVDLFTEDAVYRFNPYATEGKALVTGRRAIVDAWLESPDDPDSWAAEYQPFAVEGDTAVATGYSRYLAQGDEPERVYYNCFLLRFDDEGRCSEFTEYFMLQPG